MPMAVFTGNLSSRAVQAGGFVAEGRINGSLNLSRALGDMDYKQSKDMGPNAQVMPVSR